MSFLYTLSNLKSRVNAKILGKKDMLLDFDATLNDAVSEVFSENDMRSARRKARLTPNLFNDVYTYAAPSDISGSKIINLPPQVTTNTYGEFHLTSSEQFDRLRKPNMIALEEYNGLKFLKVVADISNDKTIVASQLDSLTSGGGTWALFGDGENVAKDSDDFIRGAGSVKYGISSAGGTTAGIANSGLNSIDISDDFLGGLGAMFVYAYITDTTNITNFIARIGSDTSNYHTITVTTDHAGNAFTNGWNLLRFNLTSMTDTGSPDDSAITYIALYMTKDAAKVSETDYRFDYIVFKKGVIHDVHYYTKFGWQSSAGAYKRNSTDDSDLLVADDDEYRMLIIPKCIMRAAQETNDIEIVQQWSQIYDNNRVTYRRDNPSEAIMFTTEYYQY